MHVWEFRQGTKGKERCSCHDISRYDVKNEYFSSLTKCRQAVKNRVKAQSLSKDNWTEENWVKENKWCIVNNSGGNGIFSFTRIEVL